MEGSKTSGCCLGILSVSSQLFLAEEESLDQDYDPNPDQDECANGHARDIGRADELNGDCDNAEKDQADDTAQKFSAQYQFRTTRETQGDHDSGLPPGRDEQFSQAVQEDTASDPSS
jgi:hypothetical protein